MRRSRFQLTPDQVRQRAGALVELHSLKFRQNLFDRVFDPSDFNFPAIPAPGKDSETRAPITVERKPDRSDVHEKRCIHLSDKRDVRMPDAENARGITTNHLFGSRVRGGWKKAFVVRPRRTVSDRN